MTFLFTPKKIKLDKILQKNYFSKLEKTIDNIEHQTKFQSLSQHNLNYKFRKIKMLGENRS